MTSGWFCLESSLITLAISAAAFSFYRDRTTQKARKMFHASLLYLPVFMSGLLFHRLTDNQQSLPEEDSEKIVELSSSSETVPVESEDMNRKKKLSYYSSLGRQVRAPVAYASVAPFPFLPAPSYAEWLRLWFLLVEVVNVGRQLMQVFWVFLKTCSFSFYHKNFLNFLFWGIFLVDNTQCGLDSLYLQQPCRRENFWWSASLNNLDLKTNSAAVGCKR